MSAPKPIIVSFLEKTQKTDGCWIWLGSQKDRHGHGQIWWNGKKISANRVAWLLFRGDIPSGMRVLHYCGNPTCVNPDHLYIGTQSEACKKDFTDRFLRFLADVQKIEGCWLWQGSKNNQGYGQIWLGNTMILAHRASWQYFRGEIPEGLLVLHHCDTRLCINPDHLFLGTHKDNMQDCKNKHRLASDKYPEIFANQPRGKNGRFISWSMKEQ